jgi:hypothetical protein
MFAGSFNLGGNWSLEFAIHEGIGSLAVVPGYWLAKP